MKEEIEEGILEKQFNLLDEIMAHAMIPKTEENWKLQGEPSKKFDYGIKYYAPPSFYINEPIIPTRWGFEGESSKK